MILIRDHIKIRAFELADELVLDVYSATRSFPDDERFGLTSQIRRAAVSCPSNIVEGAARNTESDFLRFLDYAFGSVRELNYQLSVAQRLNMGSTAQITAARGRADEVERVLAAYIRTIRNSNQKQTAKATS